ncbi:hypothetical protein K492DRAFT_222683 [Lichtheimia hyalospora FSU 10163]|nr:hypothetical protein K492DRAFT_222683 [Lichtheimia hyalospora FSU 10163]
MDHSIWNQLRQQPKHNPVSSKKYAQLVDDSTQQLHHSLESILLALDERALGLVKCANFDAALDDANVMQQISPTSALGYLRAATIYSEQGKQRHVVDICNQGLNNVDTKDPHYDSLQRTKANAKQRDNQHIDFISQLPVDIVVTKLIPLFMHDNMLDSFYPHPYMNVSKSWCDRIIQCFGGLRFITDYEEDRNVIRCSQVIPHAQHTKALFIAWYSQGNWLSDLLRDNDFCSLQELHINVFASNQTKSLLSSLSTISSTLMDFSVTFKANHTLPIADIVSTCSNLRSLSVIQPHSADLSSLPMTLWHQMTTLSLTKAANAIKLDQIVGIWKRFPSLKYLRLGPCADLQSAFVVSEYCPSMTSLELRFNNGPVDITYSDQGDSYEEQGITDLSIDGYLPNNWDFKELTNNIPIVANWIDFFACSQKGVLG